MDLRRQSVESLVSLGFPGYAIGGLSLGEAKEVTWEVADEVTELLPREKPRYLMGVGSPEDIVEGVAKGCDIFDSALPTRVARNGALFTGQGRRNISNAVYRGMKEPVDPECDCYTCRTFSAAYLHHLFGRQELLAYRLATVHNLYFYLDFMKQIRYSIAIDKYKDFKNKFLANYKKGV